MKRFLLVAGVCAAFAGSLGAAAVTGRVSFLTKRGQKPVPNETLVSRLLRSFERAARTRGAVEVFDVTDRVQLDEIDVLDF